MFLENNMKLINDKYPALSAAIDKVSIDYNKYEILQTKSGNWTVRVKNNTGSTLIHSLYDPIREANKIATSAYDASINKYVIIGLGFGYHVIELMSLSNDSEIHILELNIEMLLLAIKWVDLAPIIGDSRVILHTIADLRKMGDVFTELTSLSGC